MRKLLIMMVAFFSILDIWGVEKEFTYEYIKEEIEKIKGTQEEVLKQANSAPRITQPDREKAPKALEDAFDNLDKVVDLYEQIGQNPELQMEVQKAIQEFLNSYLMAILHPTDHTQIQVRTNSFITVCEESSAKLGTLYEKANEYVKTHRETEEENNKVVAQKDLNDESFSEKDRGSMVSKSVIWIGSGIILLLLILSGTAFIKSLHANRQLRDLEGYMAEIERKVTLIQSEIKHSKYKGGLSEKYVSKPQKSSYSKTSGQSLQHVKQNDVEIISSYSQGEPEGKMTGRDTKNKTHKADGPHYLYATTKAQSSIPEFFKVSNENLGDKVFMLILPSPEDEVAEFTISPNMSPDFMKSVIIDRETYLPSLFCEKIVSPGSPTHIEVESKGKAKKIEGKWQIQERMKVRLV